MTRRDRAGHRVGRRVATSCAPGRKPWETVSMGHYQRPLVYVGRGCCSAKLGPNRLSAKATLEITGRTRDPRRDGPEFGIGKIGPTART